MRALRWVDTDVLELDDVPPPNPRNDAFLVNPLTGSICGSDLTIVAGRHPRARAPLTLGHEFVGRVEAPPDGYNGPISVGDRVVVEPLVSCGGCRECRRGNTHLCENLKLLGVETDGGFAEQVYVAPSKVYAAPERLSHEELALCEPAAVAVHAVSLAQPAGDEFAVVLGAGPIGLLCAQVLRAFGVESVLVSEVSEPKLAIASELGFQTLDARDRRVPETIREANGGRGADIVIEATGVAEAATDIVDAGGNRARIIMVALHKSPTPILFRDLAYREQTIQGARIYADGDFVRAIQLLTAHRIETKPLITHRFALSGYYAAFAAARSPKTCKVVMDLS